MVLLISAVAANFYPTHQREKQRFCKSTHTELLAYLITKLGRWKSLVLCGFLDLETMFVCACEEKDGSFWDFQPVKPSEYVRGD